MKVNSVLVATDLSEAADPIYRVAVDLAGRLGARATLLHVNEVEELRLPASSAGTAARWRQVLREVAEQETARLELARAAFEEAGIPVETITVSNNPTVEICEIARERDIDLVVLGRRGARRLKGNGVGRTTRQVLRRSRVPVLVVPDTDGRPGVVLGRLTAGTNFTPNCAAGLRETLELASDLDVAVDVVHVTRLPVPFALGPDTWRELFPEESLAESRASLALHIEEAVGETLARFCNPIAVWGTSVAETLRDVVRSSGSGLVAVPARGARPNGLLGTSTENVLKLSPVPVLVFPAAYLGRNGGAHGWGVTSSGA
jgi:nucleotide-binding universal stress UspA family protein